MQCRLVMQSQIVPKPEQHACRSSIHREAPPRPGQGLG
jgi:hypothetical protein